MKTVLLHLERLRRHYGVSVKTYDHVALLDLSHSLRLWTELKQPLTKISPKFSTAISFKTAIPARKVLKAARGRRFVFSYMPGGVITYASNGSLASGPCMSQNDSFTMGIAVRRSENYIELGKYCAISPALDDFLGKALEAENQTRCTYIQWLAAEAVRVCYQATTGRLEVVPISREMIIKRVANTLDGSHPSVAGGVEADNVFDAPVHHLLQYQMGGLPLPYFIILKIAQDILDVAPKFLGLHAP
ncbi:hypothetical protein SAMN05216603_111168 [Pseudomonas benzenivorans]|nr:hypothetical protein [Pseudomonas benzenivorans]SDH66334.1 hypothetical protein SAMN05216603_111168 [Pseudomonas benzenivorans]